MFPHVFKLLLKFLVQENFKYQIFQLYPALSHSVLCSKP